MAHHQNCYYTWTVKGMVCRSVWAERSVRCMAAGAASFPGRHSPLAGSSHIDHTAWKTIIVLNNNNFNK